MAGGDGGIAGWTRGFGQTETDYCKHSTHLTGDLISDSCIRPVLVSCIFTPAFSLWFKTTTWCPACTCIDFPLCLRLAGHVLYCCLEQKIGLQGLQATNSSNLLLDKFSMFAGCKGIDFIKS